MSDDEIEAAHKQIFEYFTGVTTALTQVVLGLQAQPGYDHQVFLHYLATIQVAYEQREIEAPVRDSTYQETLSRFSKTPPHIEPFLSKQAPP